ncbi:uncharacterized protein VICG_02055 [Vittaforma corneae ATCC 50505]|uniref:Endoplasmic reticulum transmembrane protein n=1 Tax=Vittaforma corneae (strain ATCC 50505) TaxID=993615 RepID=L2GK76_VITCO|nr:uncharacterized protein VICG_02055 [Vittaforma corneae ATCC 50505]ELA40915.1 hypothetical protein VICG_02055 [Vittaforma corneae ATCC 50505]
MLLVLLSIAKCMVDFVEPAALLVDGFNEEHGIKKPSLDKKHDLAGMDHQVKTVNSPEVFIPEIVASPPQENFKHRHSYPKMPFIYSVDVQTKIVLLGIMILLFALVISTTTRMMQEVVRIRMKLNNIDTVRENNDKI